MSAPHGRSLFPSFSVMVLSLLLCMGLADCSPAVSKVKVTAEGAFRIAALEKEVRLRAYRPDVELFLEWESEG